MTRPPCEVPGCGRPHRARGYCGAHYVRTMRHGHPQADLPVEAKSTGDGGSIRREPDMECGFGCDELYDHAFRHQRHQRI